MTSKDIVITAHRNMGRADASALREKAVAGELTDTEIIDNEQAVPDYSPRADYSKAPIGSPVTHAGQIYGLLIAHDAKNHPDSAPGTEGGQTLWRIKHTTNPAKAKPWVQPDAVNTYKAGECMIWKDGFVYRALRETTYSPAEYATDWEKCAPGKEVTA